MDLAKIKEIVRIGNMIDVMTNRERQAVLEDLRYTEVIERLEPLKAAIIRYIESQI